MTTTPEMTVTMEESTKEMYRASYLRHERWAREAFGVPAHEDVTPQQVAATFLDREPGWSYATAKLYRCALAFVFKEMNNPSGDEACDMVYHRGEDGEWSMQVRERVNEERKKRKKSNPRTSAQKAKSMNPEDMLLLREELTKSRSMWARDTRIWFFAGVLTGLRPSEWKYAELQVDKDGRAVLFVHTAKNTNGRAHGPTRTLGLAQLSESNIALIAAHLETAHRYEQMGRYDDYMYNCRRLLRMTADRLWPRRTRHPSLYTARHVFAGDAKQVFDRIAVAAMMGHASTDTAYEHYGRRHRGSGGMGVTPSEEDMKQVAIRNPDYSPGEPTSEGAPKSRFSAIHKGVNDVPDKG